MSNLVGFAKIKHTCFSHQFSTTSCIQKRGRVQFFTLPHYVILTLQYYIILR